MSAKVVGIVSGHDNFKKGLIAWILMFEWVLLQLDMW